MSVEFLYLLVSRDGSAFKIGVSRNPAERMDALPVAIDRVRSLEIPMVDGNAYKTEQVLHYLFREWQQTMPHGDGYTEWFAIEAWDDVLAFLHNHRQRLGIGVIEPIKATMVQKIFRLSPDVVAALRRYATERSIAEGRRVTEQEIADQMFRQFLEP